MNKVFLALVFMALPGFVFAAVAARDPRVGVKNPAMVAPASAFSQQERAGIASKNQLTTPDVSISVSSTTDVDRSPSIKADQVGPGAPKNPEKDRRDAERAACLNNNMGVGNTFVWASRYSNANSYATMQEDVENPENNVCFVKVDVKATDARIDVSDIPSKYFEWGQNINCGSWANEESLKQKILDAKKSGRTWATVGGAVGGAAVGVGAMELFGNKLIGDKVEGQKNKKLSETEVLRSQLLVMKKDKDSRYDTFMKDLRELKTQCDQLRSLGGTSDYCERFDFDILLGI
ncbi:MAG: hypothetical protein J6T57_03100 [Alphaproteobacteria bacterium]|nr:hypothetical protein [Alphaproteobacteria bacterium]